MAETLTFLREFRSLTGEPAAHPGLHRIPASGSWELFWEFSGVFKEFRGASIQLTRSGRPVRSWDLSTAYPQLSLY